MRTRLTFVSPIKIFINKEYGAGTCQNILYYEYLESVIDVYKTQVPTLTLRYTLRVDISVRSYSKLLPSVGASLNDGNGSNPKTL